MKGTHKMKLHRITLSLSLVLALSGCSIYQARFSPPVGHVSVVNLKENNFKLIERNLVGEYGYVTLECGLYPLASLPIPLGDPRLFSQALADMYGRSQQQAEGKSTQLVNWTLDQHDLWIPIPYISPVYRSATFRADLLEFTK
jgi:hypothetical protein